ncbi:MAG TPA: ABC transporter permease, partial [Terriglobales bacterium]
MLNDIRYAVRLMRRAPLFATTVILTVALAIGANASIFSVVHAVMIRPLPFAHPDRLVQIAEKNDKLHLPNFGASVLNFIAWREQTKLFEQIAAMGFENFTLSGTGDPEQLSGNRISPALTRVLGLRPLLGRDFTEDEEKPSATAVAMIGEGVWKRRFGADPALVGRVIDLNGQPTTIVGVAPDALNLITGGDVYVPLTIDPAKEMRLNHVILVFGRLRAGTTLAQAQSEMDAIATHLGQQYPELKDWGVSLISMRDSFVTPQLKTALIVLLAAVGCVLLIACANIANLLLARAASRQREMAARAALGASRWQLVRQMLVESCVLSSVGGGVGIALAVWVVAFFNRALPANTLPVSSIQMDRPVLSFAVGMTIVTGLIFGFAPAWRMANVNVGEILKQAGRGASGGMRSWVRNTLAASEIALATVLLIAAGLMLKTFANLRGVQLGFNPHELITFQVAPPAAKYPAISGGPRFFRTLLENLRSAPGVSGAAVSSGIPFGAGNYTTHPMFTSGQSALPAGTLVPIDWRIVSP